MFTAVLSMLLSLVTVSGVSGEQTGAQTDIRVPGDPPRQVSWMSPGPPQMNVKATIFEQSAWAVEQKLRPIVYVGAKWCEPCERFKDAVKKKRLNRQLSDLHFIEFDLDIHRDGLQLAGYQSRMIPLFCLPDNKTGKSSGQCIQGSVKGPGAVGNLLPRLKQMLESETPK